MSSFAATLSFLVRTHVHICYMLGSSRSIMGLIKQAQDMLPQVAHHELQGFWTVVGLQSYHAWVLP